MAWMYNDSVIRAGKSWTDDNGITHPSNWGSWSDEEKASAGLVFEADPPPFDSRFYWAADIPKLLEDVNEVDENGDPLLDKDGNQVVTLGLKSQECARVKAQAGGLLAPTDWYVVRKSETDAAIPADVTAYRAAVRAASNSKEDQINAVTTHEEFVELIGGTPDNPPAFGEWPKP